jgi:diadenosine tetraphosphatase ApaH/serine/threonine PP2A family protein phosphatase
MLRYGFQNEMNFHLRAVDQLGIRRRVFYMEGERCVFAKFRVLTAVRFYHIEFNN